MNHQLHPERRSRKPLTKVCRVRNAEMAFRLGLWPLFISAAAFFLLPHELRLIGMPIFLCVCIACGVLAFRSAWLSRPIELRAQRIRSMRRDREKARMDDSAGRTR